MAIEYIEIAPAPVEEECAQVGEANFRERATVEMDAFINQLYREFPDASDKGVVFRKKWFNHDFGGYGYVVAYYEDSSSESADYAFNVEANTPGFWDDEALIEINEYWSKKA